MGAGASVTDLAIEVQATNVYQGKAKRDATVVEIICATNLDLLQTATCTTRPRKPNPHADGAVASGKGGANDGGDVEFIQTHEDPNTNLRIYARAWITSEAPAAVEDVKLIKRGKKVSTEHTEKTVNPAFHAFRSLEHVADQYVDHINFELVHRAKSKNRSLDRILKRFSLPLSAITYGLGQAMDIVVTVGLSNSTHSRFGCDLLAHPGQGAEFYDERQPANRSSMIAMANAAGTDDDASVGGTEGAVSRSGTGRTLEDTDDQSEGSASTTATEAARRRAERLEKHPLSRAKTKSATTMHHHRKAALTAGCWGSGLLLVNGTNQKKVWSDQYPFPTLSFVLHKAPKGGWPEKKTLFLIRHAESQWNEAIRTGNLAKLFAFDHPLVAHGIEEARELKRLWMHDAADEEFKVTQTERERRQRDQAALTADTSSPQKQNRETKSNRSKSEGKKEHATATAVSSQDSTRSLVTETDESDDEEYLRSEAELRQEYFIVQPENDVQKFMGADVVFASPLTRAMQTAMVVLEQHHTVRYGRGIIALKSLRERKTRVGWDSVGKAVGDEIAERCHHCFEATSEATDKLRSLATHKAKSKFKQEPLDTSPMQRVRSFGNLPTNVYVDFHNCTHTWWRQRDDYDTHHDLVARMADFMSTVQFFPGRSNSAIAVGHSLWIREFCKAYTGMQVVRSKPRLVQDMVTWKLSNAGCLKLELTFFGKRGPRITDAALLFGSTFSKTKNALAVRQLSESDSPESHAARLSKMLPAAAAEAEDEFSDLEDEEVNAAYQAAIVASDGTNLRDLDEEEIKATDSSSFAPSQSASSTSTRQHTLSMRAALEAKQQSKLETSESKQPAGTNELKSPSKNSEDTLAETTTRQLESAPCTAQKKGPRDRSNSEILVNDQNTKVQSSPRGTPSTSQHVESSAPPAQEQTGKVRPSAAAASSAEAVAAEAAAAARAALAAATAIGVETKTKSPQRTPRETKASRLGVSPAQDIVARRRQSTPPASRSVRLQTPPQKEGKSRRSGPATKTRGESKRAATKAKREAKRLARLQHMQAQQSTRSSPGDRKWDVTEEDE